MSLTVSDTPTTWLCPSEPDRARLLDITRRILPASLGLALICLPFVVLLTLRIGLIVLAPYLVVAAIVVPMGTVLPRLSHPEIWLFAGDLLVTAGIAAEVAISGGSGAPGIALLIWPVIAVGGRHTQRGLLVHVAVTIAFLTAACALAINTRLLYGDLRYTGLLTCIVGVAVLVVALTRAERQAREQALVDPLTGVLNRLALRRRVEELGAQASHRAGSLSVIAADIDHFKEINDTYGHDLGDVVLCGIAHALRTNLRAFPLLYRTGGEEFVAMLPGLNNHEGEQIAERMRAAVESACPGEIPVTMSFGVATSAASDLDPTAVLKAADRCLYRAKRAGRNRVIADAGVLAPAEGDREVAAPWSSITARSTRLRM
jgi:diguanylate cyclase (GGDEF)-like protein